MTYQFTLKNNGSLTVNVQDLSSQKAYFEAKFDFEGIIRNINIENFDTYAQKLSEIMLSIFEKSISLEEKICIFPMLRKLIVGIDRNIIPYSKITSLISTNQNFENLITKKLNLEKANYQKFFIIGFKEYIPFPQNIKSSLDAKSEFHQILSTLNNDKTASYLTDFISAYRSKDIKKAEKLAIFEMFAYLVSGIKYSYIELNNRKLIRQLIHDEIEILKSKNQPEITKFVFSEIGQIMIDNLDQIKISPNPVIINPKIFSNIALKLEDSLQILEAIGPNLIYDQEKEIIRKYYQEPSEGFNKFTKQY
jgi:hypothetical protein